MRTQCWRLLFLSGWCLLPLLGCEPWNNPYPAEEIDSAIYYASFAERPKTLDPAESYSSNETLFTSQIYEPPLQYHYLLRPYQLTPLTVSEMPRLDLFDDQDKPLESNASSQTISYSTYTIKIKRGIRYQPHPAFAKDQQNQYLYHALTDAQLDNWDIEQLSDFKQVGTRELTAHDYVYQIKRLAHPNVDSPIFGLMSDYIEGLGEYAQQLNKIYRENTKQLIDLHQHPLTGAKVLDRYTYQIRIRGYYPQFLYWLAMPFFSPMPWEAITFYEQEGMEDRNITLDWYPVGTGPYQLTENNPNSQMVLMRNPHFDREVYPSDGEKTDKDRGLLAFAGQRLPFIEQAIFRLEKESIPRWNKFLQGYYDVSGITSDSFDQAITVDQNGQPYLTPAMQSHDIDLKTSVGLGIYYIGFNMLDEVVGGSSERARLLRQAISIAVNFEEYISIFLNGRGIPAQSPLPPGIFGYQTGERGLNPVVYTWTNDRPKRRSLDEAKALLAKAGYPNGIDIKTGKPLLLNYDVPTGSSADDKALFAWLRKQFSQLGIPLNIRATQYNRFQNKMRKGSAQLFFWGWSADYPDPENFLFLLYGPNGKVKFGGENAANYQNPRFDELFPAMRDTQNGEKRQALINELLTMIREDAPWIFGFHPQNFSLSHAWLSPDKPNEMANNTLKYRKLDKKRRTEKRRLWNQPILWPIALLGLVFLLSMIPIVVQYYKKVHRATWK